MPDARTTTARATASSRVYIRSPALPQPAENLRAPSGPPPAIERQPTIPGGYVEEGVASWYGVPFNGHRTSNGEIYDMHEFTAAHRTLPFNCTVRVTNLDNGKHTEVRINDRGPFVANRIIDLSLVRGPSNRNGGTGTANVRLEILSGPSPQVGFFAVQIGAFRVEENAERLKTQMEGLTHRSASPRTIHRTVHFIACEWAGCQRRSSARTRQ